MPIEIAILSGARQGERIAIEADTLRIGAERACEVRFDPERDGAILGHAATIQREEDGWRIRNTGIGDVLVNHAPVFGNARLRSGDIVRMSERGPDFLFTIGAPAQPAATAQGAPAARPVAEVVVPADALGSLGSPLDDAHLASGPALPKLPRKRRTPRPVVALVLSIALILTSGGLALIGWWVHAHLGPSGSAEQDVAVSGKTTEQPSRSVSAAPTVPENSSTEPIASSPPAEQDALAHAEPTLPATATKDEPDEPPAVPGPPVPESPTGPWAAVERGLQRSVYLLVVEQPDGRFTYPFATASAVGRNTLLTSASVVRQLENDFRAKGFRLWAKNEATGVKAEVVGLDVFKGWLVTPERRERIYFDLGGVRVKENLPEHVPLAAADDLASLATGQEVACLGIAHDCDPIEGEAANRFAQLAPRAAVGKILTVTRLDAEPGSPRLLHVKGSVPRNVFGAPVVNAAGRLLGVYAEAANVPDDPGLKLHYAPVLVPELIRQYVEGKGQTFWTPTGAPPVLQPLPPPTP
ncbi:MAG: hypothetical protein JW809_17215 [Pirellulales bacterium]|nr:hypothetical protein [Pirellulales bacterium]